MCVYISTHRMGRVINYSTRMDQGCKIHPSYSQSQGVCPSCLKEKLIEALSSPSGSFAFSTACYASNSSTCSTLSPYTSYAPSCDSPAGLRRMVKTKSFSCMLISHDQRRNNKKQPLMKKSRSMAFVIEEKVVEDIKKKGRFWSRFSRKSKKEACLSDEGRLQISSTTKEKASSKWILF